MVVYYKYEGLSFLWVWIVCYNFTIFAQNVKQKPHLFTFIIDDMGWKDLGALGAEYRTTFLDQLITQESVFLDQYYVHPTCTPSRSALMTGLYSFKLGLQPLATIAPCAAEWLPHHIPTIAERLKTAGYQTHAFGKWHLGYASYNNTPTGRGFDTFSGLFQGGGDYDEHTMCHGEVCAFDFWDGTELNENAKGVYTNDILFEKVMSMIEEYSHESPLFAYVAWQTIHAPVTPPPRNYTECDNVDFWRRQIYCNKLNHLSTHMELIFNKLKETGIWDNSLIVVTSDNGGMPNGIVHSALGNGAGWNFPFRGGKATIFEGGIRGAAFITGGLLPPELKGKNSSALLHAVDISAGQLAAAGLPISDDMDGVDLFRVVFNEEEGHEMIFLDLHKPDEECLKEGGPCASGIRSGPWKYIEGPNIYDGYFINVTGPAVPANQNCDDGCLFNLDFDPSERNNLIDENPEMVHRLRMELKEAKLEVNGYVPPQEITSVDYCMDQAEKLGVWKPWLTTDDHEDSRQLSNRIIVGAVCGVSICFVIFIGGFLYYKLVTRQKILSAVNPVTINTGVGQWERITE